MRKLLILILVLFLFGMGTVFALTNSIIYCDGTALIENITVYVDNNITTVTFPTNCTWGCDNVTNSCREPKIEEYKTYFTILVILLIIAGVIIKLFR